MAILTLEEARGILADDVLGLQEVEQVFGRVAPAVLREPILFTRDDLLTARQAGEMLVLRITQGADDAPLTMLQIIGQYPDAFDGKLLRQMGYQLKDDWGITLEPRAATDTCQPGWALVRKAILDDSRNLLYEDQETTIRAYAQALGVPSGAVRRRAAVEAVYDTLLYHVARRVRLLEKTWDWSNSVTIDGGHLNVGGFAASGLQILSFSEGVRHGGLGVCPTRQRSGQ